MFESLSSSKTKIDFVNKLEKRPLFNILYYLYYYNGAGVAAGDINNDGLPDLYFTANHKSGNKLYLNKGHFEFEDITEKSGVAGISDWCTGVTMADVNGDGYLDIYTAAISGKYDLKGHNQLFINQQNGTFKDLSSQYGLDFAGLTTQTAFFDYDHDGDLDCYILNQSHHPHANIKDTSFRRTFDPLTGDRLYRNDLATSGKFTDVSAQSGIYQSTLGYGLGLAIADLNNDGWDDIYIGNDFHENDYYYVNNGNGTFTESGAKHFRHYSRFSMGNDIADFNNDGQPDIITVDMLPGDEKVLKTYGSDENPDVYKVKLELNGYQKQYSKNSLQRNNGDGSSFSDVALVAGISATDWSWAPLFADFDNDGNKDLFITSGIVKRPVDMDYVKFISDLDIRKGRQMTDAYDEDALKSMPDGSSHPYFFKGDGVLQFTDVSEAWGTADLNGFFNGAAYADLDGDGNLDVVVNSIDAPAVILKNKAPAKTAVNVQLKGDSMNRFGIGAKVWVFVNGKMQYQQMMLTRGFQSSVEPVLHFGLDNVRTIDSILVVWPNQKFSLQKAVPAAGRIQLMQSQAHGHFDYNTFFLPKKPILQEVSSAGKMDWLHVENDFLDYNVQYLIPHSQSTRGPKLAVGDVNGDGLDDFYACGAKGQPGTLMMQGTNGGFTPFDTNLFAAEAGSEDVDALFLDANGDGKQDLYVVSGGNEAFGNDSVLLDRLYLNTGGHLVKSNGLPLFFSNKSCVTAADVDHDGDTDLFVGTLSDARAYGVPQTSYLLINDGKANFSIAPQNMIALGNIGMVTSAAFADVNRDGWKDLVVVGEWMPVSIFINNNGTFRRTNLPASSGWWQTVFVDDVNGDGAADLLLGNWGWNNKFWSGKNGPVRLYVKDFDRNGRVDQLLSYTINGKEYPFLAKDEAERSLPVLKKHYLKYAEFAGLEMKDAYYGFAEQVEPIIAERMGSALCLGDGKGGFAIRDLPAGLQLSPQFAFQKISDAGNGKLYLTGGNFFDVIPYEGQYDAQPLALFRIDKNGNATVIPQTNLSGINEQVRDVKWIRSANQQQVLAVAGNRSKLLFFKLNQ